MPEVEDLDDETLAPEVDDADLEQPVDDDDLPADEGDAEHVDEPVDDDQQPPPRRARANERIRALTAERDRERADAAALRAQVAASLRQPPPDPAAEEAAFRARIAELPYEDQITAHVERERQRMGQALGGIEMRLAQSDDRVAFNGLVSRNPIAARHADAVEAEAGKYAAQGRFVSREIILKNILGDLALNRGPAAARRAGDRGARRIADAQGRGATRGSDVPGRQRADPNSLEALEARLKDQFI